MTSANNTNGANQYPNTDEVRADLILAKTSIVEQRCPETKIEKLLLDDAVIAAFHAGTSYRLIAQQCNEELARRSGKNSFEPVTLSDIKRFADRLHLLSHIHKTQAQIRLAGKNLVIHEEVEELVLRIKSQAEEIDLKISQFSENMGSIDLWRDLHKTMDSKLALLLSYLKATVDLRNKATDILTTSDFVNKLMTVVEAIVHADYIGPEQKKRLIDDVKSKIEKQQEEVVIAAIAEIRNDSEN